MKPEFACITSMDQNYFSRCGKAMLDSYQSRFTKKIPLFLYNEDNFNPKIKGVKNMGWDLGEDYLNFIARWKDKNSRVTTFSKKAFSIIHAMKNIECDYLIWLDADVICKKPMPYQLFELITSDSILSTHFGVIHEWPLKDNLDNISFSCETGFFILNKNHTKFNTFVSTYENFYIHDQTENLRRFYDGEVYGATVKILEKENAKMLDLNPGNAHKTPIPRSILAPYISHYKAGLKDTLKENN